ncbi:MAG: branched-chain amino acid ABC transporter permease [Desulfobacterales bacterium]|nr:branched-chain amino acid ABC transporter permease [Desulfobacterales bacterium]
MTTFFQFFVNGVMSGGVYSLIALGIVLIYKSSSIFNFAIGEMVMLGAFFMWTFFDMFGLPFTLSLILTILASGGLGFLMQKLAIQPLIGQPILSAILVTLGLSHILSGAAMLTWGGTTERLSATLPGKPLLIGDVIIPHDLLWCFVVAVFIFVVFGLFYKYSRIGLAMRAVAEDHEIAQARGINVRTTFAVIWFVAGVIASVGGILLGFRLGVTQFLSLIALKAFPAVLFGGIESIGGAFLGGIIVGLLESLTGGYIDPWIMEISPYIILLLVLVIRPEGLFGLERIERI